MKHLVSFQLFPLCSEEGSLRSRMTSQSYFRAATPVLGLSECEPAMPGSRSRGIGGWNMSSALELWKERAGANWGKDLVSLA